MMHNKKGICTMIRNIRIDRNNDADLLDRVEQEQIKRADSTATKTLRNLARERLIQIETIRSHQTQPA